LAVSSSARDRQTGIPPVALVGGAMMVVVLAAFYYLDRAAKRPAPPPPPLSGEARTYVKNLRLLDVEMKANESYLKQAVVEIVGKIGNNGNRVMKLVEINCVFYDTMGQVVLRERVPIVNRKMGMLAPDEIKSFRLPFDNIPESWNQAMPQMVIAGIEFN
jgi:hypothetical protein